MVGRNNISMDLYSILAQAASGHRPSRGFNVRPPAYATLPETNMRCQARGTYCNNSGVIISDNGVDRMSMHCTFHACRRVERGQLCRVAKVPSSEAYCNEHMRCVAVDMGGGRCFLDVKNGNAGRYSYCDTLHLCKARDCNTQRYRADDGEDYDYCFDHRCGSDGCHKQRKDRGPFCAEHTCEADGCYNEARHSSGSGSSAQQVCDRHRRCRVSRCGRVCDVWEDGQVAPHCASHCCQSRGCENEKRSGARYCASHGCARDGCSRSRARGASFCEEHKCARGTCQDRRRGGGRFCPSHTCSRSGCESEAISDRFCSRHGQGDGYQRYGDVGQRGDWPSWPVRRLCPYRHPDLCRILDCIEHSSRALGNHLPSPHTADDLTNFTECDYRPCDDLCRRGHVFCRRHKCEIGSCLRLKAGLAAHDSREPTTAVSARFCTQHECDVPRCSNQAAGNRTYCGDHTCRDGGCERQTRPGSVYCDFCGRGGSPGGWEDVYWPAYSPASTGWPVWPQFRRS